MAIKINKEFNLIFNEHPHFKNREVYKSKNTAYIADNENDYGVFKYREELVLTKNGFPKSFWSLPKMFHPSNGTKISRHSEKDFELRGDNLLFKSRGIGQDFVISGNPKIEIWARNIINESEKIKPASKIA